MNAILGFCIIGICTGIVIGCNVMEIICRKSFEKKCRECRGEEVR